MVLGEPVRWSWQQQRGAWSVLALTGLAMLVWTWRAWADPVVDFGRELFVAWRISEGDVLYREVAHVQGPLSPYVNGAVFAITAPGLITQALTNVALIAATAALLWRLIARVAGDLSAFMASLTFLVLFAFGHFVPIGNFNWVTPYGHEGTHGLILTMAMLAALDQWGHTSRRRWIVLAGLALGLTALTRAEAAGVAGLTAAAYGWVKRDWRAWPWMAGAAVTPTILAIALLSLAMPVSDAATGVLGTWLNLGTSGGIAWPFFQHLMGLLDPWRTGYEDAVAGAAWLGIAAAVTWIARKPAKWRAPAVTVAILLVAAAGWKVIRWDLVIRPLPLLLAGLIGATVWTRSAADEARWRQRALVLALAVFGLMQMTKMLPAARLYHYGFTLAMPGVMVLIAALFGWWPAWVRRQGGSAPIVLAASAALWIVTVAFHLSMMQSRLAVKQYDLGSGLDRMRCDARALVLQPALQALRMMPPGTTVMTVPDGDLLPYLARLGASNPYHKFMPLEMRLYDEDRVLEAWQQRPPDCVLVVHRQTREYGAAFFGRDYAAKLGAWIDSHYRQAAVWGAEPLQEDDAFGVALLRRRQDTGGP